MTSIRATYQLLLEGEQWLVDEYKARKISWVVVCGFEDPAELFLQTDDAH